MTKRLAFVTAWVIAAAFAATASAVVTASSSSLNPFRHSARSRVLEPFGPVEAMKRLPATPVSDPLLLRTIQRSAPELGGDPVSAVQSLRLLVADVGTTHSDLYAYTPSQERFCFVLWRRQGACSTGSSTGMRGARALLSPGGPGYVGQHGDVPPVVFGVVTDEVSTVTLVDGNQEVPLEIANNAFANELAKAPRSSFVVTLRFTYSNGSTTSVDLRQDAPT